MVSSTACWLPLQRSAAERANDQVFQREVAPFADARDEQVVVVADESELIEGRDAATDLHRFDEKVTGYSAAVHLDLGCALAAQSAVVVLLAAIDEPRQVSFEGDVHVDDDILDALETTDRLVVELDPFFGVDAALVEGEGETREREAGDEQTAAVQRRDHHFEAAVDFTEHVVVADAGAVEDDGAGARLLPQLLAAHLLVGNTLGVDGDDEARRPLAVGSLGVGQSVNNGVARPLCIGRPALLAGQDPIIAIADGAHFRVRRV